MPLWELPDGERTTEQPTLSMVESYLQRERYRIEDSIYLRWQQEGRTQDRDIQWDASCPHHGWNYSAFDAALERMRVDEDA